MAASVCSPSEPVQVRVGGQTDIGGGRENQDMWFCWKDPRGNEITVFGVLDGHGREVGRLAAISGRDAMMDWLELPTSVDQLRQDPVKAFGRMFAHAHLTIKQNFRRCLETTGWQVEEAPDGFLMRRRHESQPWSCLHGGASCSVMALVDNRLLSANVGDSSSLLCLSEIQSSGNIQSIPIPARCSIRLCDLGSINLHDDSPNNGFKLEKAFLADAQANMTMMSTSTPPPQQQEPSSPSSSSTSPTDDIDNSSNTQIADEHLTELLSSCANVPQSATLPCTGETLPEQESITFVVTPDHSPEALTEFERIRRSRCQPFDSSVPELLMVYDSPNAGSKAACPHVFEVGGNTSGPRVTNKGKYYKNVRSEWASLVATPPTARFQDALAFTRSLGDFHLQSYGVCFLPEVFEVDLTTLLSTSTTPTSKFVTILVCSDGIWDNWKYETVNNFMLSKEHASMAVNDPPLPAGIRMVTPSPNNTGAQLASNKLIEKNAKLAHANFGNSADNATAVVAYLWR